MNPVIETICSTHLVGIIRMQRYVNPVEVARALAQGGLRILEYTFSGENAADAIRLAREARIPGVCIGAGTILTPADVEEAHAAGAEFVVTPSLSLAVIAACQQRGLPIVCGALSPTEIVSAMQAGADLVKLFPARLGGPQYLRDVLGPLPRARLVPTGGVSADNALSYLQAGAVAVAIGGSLVPAQLVIDQQFSELTLRARRCVEAVSAYPAAGLTQ
jgi:2-dehydro-3-deoxyphosphogluconate aldolase / (4S)-4-hydroxy-2-oxoglutarate aldolase